MVLTLACCCLVTKSCPTLCDPMNCSTPGFPVLHHLLELAQTRVHWVRDTIQPSHPLSSHSPPALHPPQDQSFFPMSWLFASCGQSIGASASTSVLPRLISFRVDWSPCILGDSQESSLEPRFESISSSALSFLDSPALTSVHDYWKTIALTRWFFVSKVMSVLLNTLSRFVIAFLPKEQGLFIHDCSHHRQWYWSQGK